MLDFIDSLEVLDSVVFCNSQDFLVRLEFGLVYFGMVWYLLCRMVGNVLEYSGMFKNMTI